MNKIPPSHFSDYEKLLDKAKELRTKRANGEMTEEDTEVK